MSEAQSISNGRPWGFWPTFGFGIAVIVIFFAIEVLVSVIFTIVKISSQTNFDPSQLLDVTNKSLGLLVAIATIATAIVCVGLIIIFIIARRGISITGYLSLKSVSPKAILISLAVVASLIIVNDITCVIIGRPVNPQVMIDMYNTSAWPAILWIAVVIFAPIFEETFFRGFLFKGFSHSKLGIIGTIFLTAVGWTLLHQQYEVFELCFIFASGILLGVMRYKTGSLWAPLTMHSFMNAIALLEVALNVNSLFG